MVAGIDSFKEWFKGSEEQYAIIGGTACDILMTEEGAVIELFARYLDAIHLPKDAVLTPLPMDDNISSLSAILLDNDYYEFLKQGKVVVDGFYR